MEINFQKEFLDNQCSHWEKSFTINSEMFGTMSSKPAQKAVEIFKARNVKKVVELGGGQGRDTVYFAQNGFQVDVLEYTTIGVETIRKKAEELGLSHLINPIQHDVRNPFPFEDNSIDAVYSHMLYCMAFTTKELEFISKEIRRILWAEGLNIYTVRNTDDIHYGQGIHRGEDMYEVGGFVVHFFSLHKVKCLAKGFDIVSIDNFEEGGLPRKLYQVVLMNNT